MPLTVLYRDAADPEDAPLEPRPGYFSGILFDLSGYTARFQFTVFRSWESYAKRGQPIGTIEIPVGSEPVDEARGPEAVTSPYQPAVYATWPDGSIKTDAAGVPEVLTPAVPAVVTPGPVIQARRPSLPELIGQHPEIYGALGLAVEALALSLPDLFPGAVQVAPPQA